MRRLVYSLPISLPSTQAIPPVSLYRPVRTDMRVVLPAPLGPSNPKISFS